MNNYALEIGGKTDMILPNGKHVTLYKGDKLNFMAIDDNNEKETVAEESFNTKCLKWEDDLFDLGKKYAIVDSYFLDRIDSAHISPDMYLDKTRPEVLRNIVIEPITCGEMNKAKVKVPAAYFHELPRSLDFVFVKYNTDEKEIESDEEAADYTEDAMKEIKEVIKKYNLYNISFDAYQNQNGKTTISVGSSFIRDGRRHYRAHTDIAHLKELYEGDVINNENPT